MSVRSAASVPGMGLDPDQPEETVKSLVGQSGCAVALCRRGAFYFVRKTSASPAYNPRLHRQIDKQRELASAIAVPVVLVEGVRDGLAYYDMDYVAGHDFATYCTQESLAAIDGLAERFLYVFSLFAGTRKGEIEPAHFQAKIAGLRAALRARPFYPEYAPVLDALGAALADADWSGIPRTACHGDFTLENIIFQSGGRLVFLDLLDGELESVWMDLAKLLQDLESGWSLRRRLWIPAPPQEARFLSMVGGYLAEDLMNRIAASFPEALPRLAQLRSLQAMRVLPYLREKHAFDRVVESLKSLQGMG